jgi:hypothetical protein
MALHFIIPGQPTAWQRAASFVQRGKVVTANPKGMREKQEAIAWACKAAQRGAPPLTGALRLEVLCVYEPPAELAQLEARGGAEGSGVENLQAGPR